MFTGFSLSWLDNSLGEEGFIIDRQINGSGWQEGYGSTEENIVNWIDYFAPVNQDITYRVKAYAGIYESDYAACDEIDNTIPAPTDPEYEILAINQIELTWTDNCVGEDGGKIDKRIGTGEWIVEYAIVGDYTGWWIDYGAEINEILSYRIYAFYEDEVSDYIEILDIDNTFPAPSDLEYEKVNIYTIQLNWQDNSVGEEGFKIDKRVGTGNWISEYAVVGENIQTWSDVEAEINEDLQYRVYAYHEDEESSSVQIGVIDNTFPAPYNLQLEELGVYNVMLTWEYDAEGLEGFKIEKKIEDGDWELYEDNIEFDEREWTDVNANDMDVYRIKAFYQEYESDFSNEVVYLNIDWVLVASGEYTWGEFDEIQSIEYDYDIMKYNVTNEQYVNCLNVAYANGNIEVTATSVTGYYEGDEHYPAGYYEFYDLDGQGRISWDGTSFLIEEDYENHPVVEISWVGANAYAEFYGWSLPTEQEWEKAARGMTGFDYPWGDELTGDRANYWDSGDPWDNGTTSAGYYNGENGTTDSHSPYGCYDMCGNVWEWTDSWYGGIHPTARVLRGGAFSDYYTDDILRSWFGYYNNQDDSIYILGFRCVRTVE